MCIRDRCKVWNQKNTGAKSQRRFLNLPQKYVDFFLKTAYNLSLIHIWKKAKANSGKAGWMMRLTGFSYVGRIENLRDLVYYKLYGKDNFWFPSVSYTHLDVYKRQAGVPWTGPCQRARVPLQSA